MRPQYRHTSINVDTVPRHGLGPVDYEFVHKLKFLQPITGEITYTNLNGTIIEVLLIYIKNNHQKSVAK